MPSSKATANIFAGGYTKEKADKVKATKTPQNIRCTSCRKLWPNHNYSERQLGVYRQRLALNPRLADESQAIIPCIKCTPSQVTELECSHCYQVKALEAFTKAQRKDPERARCMQCVNLDLKETPAGEAEVPQNLHNDDNDDDNNTVTNAYANSNTGATSHVSTNLHSAAGRLSINDSDDDSDENPYAPGSRGTMKDTSQGGVAVSGSGPAAWAAFSRQNENSRAQGAATYTGYDPAGNPHQRYRAPSTIGSIQSTTRSAPGSNFPKIKADKVINSKGDPPGLIQIPESAAAAVGRQAYTGNSSDSDDDYGYI